MLAAVALGVASPPLVALVAGRAVEAEALAAVDQGLHDAARVAAANVEALNQAAEERLLFTAEDPAIRQAAHGVEDAAPTARTQLGASASGWFESAQLRSAAGRCVVSWPRAECAELSPAAQGPAGEGGVIRQGPRQRCVRLNPIATDPDLGSELGLATLCVELALDPLFRSVGALRLGRHGQVDLLDPGGRPVTATGARAMAVRSDSAAVRDATARASARGLLLPGRDSTSAQRAAWALVPTANLGVLTSVPDAEARAPLAAYGRALSLFATIISLGLAGIVFRVSQLGRAMEVVAEGARRRAEQRAVTDALTGLNNRAAFDHALAKAVAEAGPGNCPAVIVVDLDGFKSVNDSRGHEAGDHALRAIAHAIRSAARSGDIVSRTGGDEFAVIVPDGSSDGVRELAGRLEVVIDGLGIAADLLRGTLVGGSAGWARLHPGEDGPALLRRADTAMYERKAFRKSKVDRRSGRSPAGG